MYNLHQSDTLEAMMHETLLTYIQISTPFMSWKDIYFMIKSSDSWKSNRISIHSLYSKMLDGPLLSLLVSRCRGNMVSFTLDPVEEGGQRTWRYRIRRSKQIYTAKRGDLQVEKWRWDWKRNGYQVVSNRERQFLPKNNGKKFLSASEWVKSFGEFGEILIFWTSVVKHQHWKFVRLNPKLSR